MRVTGPRKQKAETRFLSGVQSCLPSKVVCAASVCANQDLKQAMPDQLVKRQQFLVGPDERVHVSWIRSCSARLQAIGCFLDNRIRDDLSSHLPERDKAIYHGGHAHGKDPWLLVVRGGL